MTVSVSWAKGDESASELAMFFVRNVSTEYISQGDISCGRALSTQEWDPYLLDILELELGGILSGSGSCSHKRVLLGRVDERVVFLGIVSFDGTSATVEDGVVESSCRSEGIGAQVVSSLVSMLRADGVRTLFLESAGSNTRAHAFLHREGFRTLCVTMCRDLQEGEP